MTKKEPEDAGTYTMAFTMWDRVILEAKLSGMQQNDLTIGEIREALDVLDAVSFTEKEKAELGIRKNPIDSSIVWPVTMADHEHPVTLTPQELSILTRLARGVRGWPLEERTDKLRGLLGI